MAWHSSDDKIRFHFNLENLVWESHHISLGQNDLSAAGFKFLATFNSTRCLLKMSQEGAWNINSGAFIFSAQRKGHFAGRSVVTEGLGSMSSCCPSPHQLLCSGTIHGSAMSAGKLRRQCRACRGSQRLWFPPGEAWAEYLIPLELSTIP